MMRKFRMMAAAGLLAVPGLALAGGGAGYGDRPHGDRAGIEQEQEGQLGQTGEFEEGEQVRAGMPHKMDRQAQQQLFQEDAESWELEGRVQQVNQQQRMITIQRENLPPAHVYVAEQTKIRVDGQEARLNQLQPGTEVRAKFQLAQDTPIAVELEAERAEGQQQQQPGMQQQQQQQRQQPGTGAGGMQR